MSSQTLPTNDLHGVESNTSSPSDALASSSISNHDAYLKELAFLQEIRELLRHAQHNPDEFIQLKAVVKLINHLNHDIVILSSHSVLMMQLCKALRMLVMGNGFHKELKQASLKGYFILVNAILTIENISEYESREILSGLTEITLYGPEKFQEKSLETLVVLWKKIGLKETLRLEMIHLFKKVLCSDRLSLSQKGTVLDAIIFTIHNRALTGRFCLTNLMTLLVELVRFFSYYVKTQLRLIEAVLLLGEQYTMMNEVYDLLFQHIQKNYQKSPFQREDKIVLMIMTYMLNTRNSLDETQEAIIINMAKSYLNLNFATRDYKPPSPSSKTILSTLLSTVCYAPSPKERIDALHHIATKRFKHNAAVTSCLNTIVTLDPKKFLDVQLYAQYMLDGHHSGTKKEFSIINRLLQAF